MNKHKKNMCLVVIMILFSIPIYYIGELYYYCFQKRNYIKVDGYKTITVWKNYIILDKYWYPFYPKYNYILINSTWDYYDVGFTITQDSVLGIWSNYPVSVYGLESFKMIETFERSKRDYWANKYSFANVTKARKDSLILEFDYQLWYPCSLQKGMYIYKTDEGIVKKDLDKSQGS